MRVCDADEEGWRQWGGSGKQVGHTSKKRNHFEKEKQFCSHLRVRDADELCAEDGIGRRKDTTREDAVLKEEVHGLGGAVALGEWGKRVRTRGLVVGRGTRW